MHVRVLVSAYLFLTGYGHYLYANSDKKMGFKRYLQVNLCIEKSRCDFFNSFQYIPPDLLASKISNFL